MASPRTPNWMSLPLTPPVNHKVGVETCALAAAVLGIIFGSIGLSRLMHASGEHAQLLTLRHADCDSTACRSYAEMLTSSLSKTDSPCWNFYRFVCKGYANSSTSVFENHVQDFTDRVTRTLAAVVVPATGQSAFQKAAKFYQSCVAAVVQPGHGQFLTFRRIMRNAGVAWPSLSQEPDFLFSLAEIKAALDLSSLFKISASAGDLENNVTTINLTRTYTLSLLERRRKDIGADYSDYYTAFRAFYVFYDENVTKPVEYAEFLQTENYIFARLLHTEPEFSDEYAGVDALLNVTPFISPSRWSEAFRRVRTDPADTPLRVRHLDVAFLRAVSDMLGELGEARLHFYVGWVVVQLLAPFTSQTLATRFHGSWEKAVRAKPLFCLSSAERVMGLTVYAKYVTDAFDEATMRKLDALVSGLFLAMSSFLWNSSVPGFHNRFGPFLHLLINDVNLIRDEASLASLFSGFDDMSACFASNWRRSERTRRAMGRKRWSKIGSSLVKIIASTDSYWSAEGRQAKLQPYSTMLPLFDRRVARSVNYGALGSFIAVAMFRFFNENLSLETNLQWATKRNVSRCYSRLGPDPTRTLPYQRALSLTFLWKAFREASEISGWTQSRPGPVVQDLGGYTDQELFYLAFCYPFCTGHPSEEAEHSCNEPLRHSQHFPRVFGCLKSSNMNPRYKCGVGY